MSTLMACVAVMLVAGCGSSSSSTTASSAPTTSSAGSRGATGSGVKVTFAGKPKFSSPSASAPVHSGVVQVSYKNITIQPDTLRVKVGTTVMWTNLDSVEHNVTSESGPQKFASGTFGEGHTFKVTLTKPGVIHYECTIHPVSMNGTIEVVK